ncbi:MAG: hypothetical protein UBAL2_80490303a [Leptospirillum rubarum]|nr:MAG: hypothetical protein UBAL2_80490303a [Leptospirillum rubarum]
MLPEQGSLLPPRGGAVWVCAVFPGGVCLPLPGPFADAVDFGVVGPGGANRPSHPPSQNCTGESYRAYQAGGGGRSHGISFCPRITCGNRLANG